MTYGHGMYLTPSIDGWQHGYRDINGYRAELCVYGDGWIHGYNDYSLTVWDYVKGERWVLDGRARYADMRADSLKVLRDGRRAGLAAMGMKRS